MPVPERYVWLCFKANTCSQMKFLGRLDAPPSGFLRILFFPFRFSSFFRVFFCS